MVLHIKDAFSQAASLAVMNIALAGPPGLGGSESPPPPPGSADYHEYAMQQALQRLSMAVRDPVSVARDQLTQWEQFGARSDADIRNLEMNMRQEERERAQAERDLRRAQSEPSTIKERDRERTNLGGGRHITRTRTTSRTNWDRRDDIRDAEREISQSEREIDRLEDDQERIQEKRKEWEETYDERHAELSADVTRAEEKSIVDLYKVEELEDVTTIALSGRIHAGQGRDPHTGEQVYFYAFHSGEERIHEIVPPERMQVEVPHYLQGQHKEFFAALQTSSGPEPSTPAAERSITPDVLSPKP